ESSNSDYLNIKSITYYDQYLYFYFRIGCDNYLGRLHLDESDENALSYTDFASDPNITAMGIYKNDSELNLIYVSYDNESSKCIKIPIKEDTELSLDQANSVSLYTMSSDDSVRKISDLQVIGDTCYLLLMEYLPSIDYGNNNYYLSDGVKTLLHTCTGGIIKINLKTGTVEKWKNGSEVFGEYKFNGSFYEFDYHDWEYKEKTNSSITAIPPLEQANNYFYGPVKFIAKKPDALVIADDGIYIDAEIDEDSVISKLKKFKNMNRMVTLDLKKELMSAVDVNVIFSTSVEQESCWFCINCQD
ncbi:MAG: hypothetical protein K5866_02745, partial [Treponema sp.]|nr:hypothetical protein [Treponema sp.]